MNIKHMLLILFVIAVLALSACGSPAAPATVVPIPTLEPTPTPEPMDAGEIVQGFWDAINAQKLDEAMVFVADDVTCRGACYLSGKDSLQSFLQGTINSGITVEISDLLVDGEKVTYTFRYYKNGVIQMGGNDSMQVQDGKIIAWKFVKP